MSAQYIPETASDIGAEPANANIQSHIGIVAGNPHGTTAAQVGAASATITTVDGHATGSLSAAQVSATRIHNVGQNNTACDLTIPTCVAGYGCIVRVAETSTAAWRFKAGASDKFFLNGVAGSDAGYIGFPLPTLGNCMIIEGDENGAGIDWFATVVSGNVTVS